MVYWICIYTYYVCGMVYHTHHIKYPFFCPFEKWRKITAQKTPDGIERDGESKIPSVDEANQLPFL